MKFCHPCLRFIPKLTYLTCVNLYQLNPSPPPPKMALVRSASENQAVKREKEKEEDVVKEEVLWTDAMVQDMFDCLDQVLKS